MKKALRGLGWVGEKRERERQREKKKWAGLVRLIAPELCRKNKLSCRMRAELGWAEEGMGIGGRRKGGEGKGGEGRGGLGVDQQGWKIPRFQIRRLGT